MSYSYPYIIYINKSSLAYRNFEWYCQKIANKCWDVTIYCILLLFIRETQSIPLSLIASIWVEKSSQSGYLKQLELAIDFHPNLIFETVSLVYHIRFTMYNIACT